MTKGDGSSAIAAVREGACIGLWQMMCVHHKLTHTRRHEMIEGIGDERFVENRNEGLGELVRERTQALAETRAEDEGLMHARLLSGSGAGANLNPADHTIFTDLNAFGGGDFRQGWHAPQGGR